MQCYYVYLLLDPRKYNQPFYVGKGKANRAFCHIKHAYKQDSVMYNRRKQRYIREMLDEGVDPIVFFWKDLLLEDQALQIEEHLIRMYGRHRYDEGGILMNVRVGDRVAEDLSEKLSKAHKGRSKSEAHKKAIGQARLGIKPVNMKPVDLLDLDGNIIKTYESAASVALYLGYKRQHITDACRNNKVIGRKHRVRYAPDASYKLL